MESVWRQDVEALEDGVERGDWRRQDAGQGALDALEPNDGARRGFRHDLIVGTQAGERATLDNRMGGGLEGLPEGVDDEARRMVALQQTEDLLRQALVGGVVEATVGKRSGAVGIQEWRGDGKFGHGKEVTQTAEDMEIG